MAAMTAELEGKMRQLKRLMLSYSDFKHAKLAASRILGDGLHDNNGSEGHLIHEALNCSMIMAYCRPFSGNDKCVPDLPGRLLRCLNSEQRGIHEVVMRDRNCVLAHSEAEALQIEPVVWKVAGQVMVVPLKEWGLVPLGKEATTTFLSAADKLFMACMEERDRLEPELIPFMRTGDPSNPFA